MTLQERLEQRFHLMTFNEIQELRQCATLMREAFEYETALLHLITATAPIHPGDLASKDVESWFRRNGLSYRCIVDSTDGWCVASYKGAQVFRLIWRDCESDEIADTLAEAFQNRKKAQEAFPRGMFIHKLNTFKKSLLEAIDNYTLKNF